jgi:hypothetical protein
LGCAGRRTEYFEAILGLLYSKFKVSLSCLERPFLKNKNKKKKRKGGKEKKKKPESFYEKHTLSAHSRVRKCSRSFPQVSNRTIFGDLHLEMRVELLHSAEWLLYSPDKTRKQA